MAKNTNLEETISVEEARNKFRSYTKEVYENKDGKPLIVERKGKPVVAIIPYETFLHFQDLHDKVKVLYQESLDNDNESEEIEDSVVVDMPEEEVSELNFEEESPPPPRKVQKTRFKKKETIDDIFEELENAQVNLAKERG